MKILILGANGFVGSSLAEQELDRGNQVICLVRDFNHKTRHDILERCIVIHGDILDLDLLKRIIADYEIELIYHVAAQSIVRIANRNPVDCYLSNVLGTINVLEAVRLVNKKIKIVCASSDKAYGIHETLPYTEDMKLQPDDPYATSKACADLIAQSYHKTYGLDVNVIRCANIYGQDMNTSRIIPNTIIRILNGERPQIYSGVLHYKREFIFIDDVCSAYQLIGAKGVPGEIYNIGDSEFYTVEDIVKRISRLMDYEGDIDIIGKDFLEIPFQYLSAIKLNGLGWEKKTTLTEGLIQTINWYTAGLEKA
jgi:CDP-glucose 4,6-dehydratase